MTDHQKEKVFLAQFLNFANEKTKTQAIKLVIVTTMPLHREQCGCPTSESKRRWFYILNTVSGFKELCFAFYKNFKWAKYSTSKVIKKLGFWARQIWNKILALSDLRQVNFTSKSHFPYL